MWLLTTQVCTFHTSPPEHDANVPFDAMHDSSVYTHAYSSYVMNHITGMNDAIIMLYVVLVQTNGTEAVVGYFLR